MGHTFGIETKKVSTTQKAKLKLTARNGFGKWVYVKALETIDQYACCFIDKTGGARMVAQEDLASVVGICIPQVAMVANDYVWAWQGDGAIAGDSIKVRVAANCAEGADLYAQATGGGNDGVLDDSASAADIITGLALTATNGGATAAVECIGYAELRMVIAS